MSTDLLPSIEIETAPDPDAVAIWLHGLGDDGSGWSEIVPALKLPSTPRVRFLFPHAPVMPVTINRGYPMRAWYDIRENDFNERADISGVKQSQAQVEALISREKARGIAAGRIVLAGFSQGGAIALYAGLRHAERLAAIVALSTYVIAPDTLASEATEANRDLRKICGNEIIAKLPQHIIAGRLPIQNLHERGPVLCSASIASVCLPTELQNSSSAGCFDARPSASKVSSSCCVPANPGTVSCSTAVKAASTTSSTDS